MNKPVTIMREELKASIVKAINESNLPAFVAADIIERILGELRQLERQQYEQDLRRYESECEVDANACEG